MPTTHLRFPALLTGGRTGARSTVGRLLGWAAVLLYVFAFQGSRALWQPDEGRYVDVAVHMVRNGDYLIPYLNHETLHLTKPPVTYWAIAAGLRLLGSSEWIVRLPWALAFLGTVFLVRGMARRLASGAEGWAALAYATFFMPYVAANIVTTDTLLALWEALAMYGVVRLWWDDGGHPERWRLVLWLGFGLAFLTKGPPGLMPLLAVVAFAAVDRQRRFRRLVSLPSLACFAVVGFAWYGVVAWKVPAASSYFFVFELYDRVFTSVHNRSPQWYGAFTVYLPTLLAGTLPWAGVLVRTAWRWAAKLWRGGWRELRRPAPESLFLALWIGLPLLVLSLARSRLPLYALPLFVPLAVLVGRRLGAGFRLTRRRWILLGLWVLFLVALRGTVAALPNHKDTGLLARFLESHVRVPYDEVVFVAATPYYGLSFYQPVDVEYVSLHPYTGPERPLSPPQSLLQELEERERRILVVPDYHWDAFTEYAEQEGLVIEPLGRWYEYYLVRLDAGASGGEAAPVILGDAEHPA